MKTKARDKTGLSVILSGAKDLRSSHHRSIGTGTQVRYRRPSLLPSDRYRTPSRAEDACTSH
jgi:hypothetical protein